MALTEEDKAWFTGQIGARFEQIYARFEQVDARFEQVDARFEHIEESIERVETSLLTEFHKWASPNDSRARSHAASLRALEEKVEYLEDRLTKLERPSASH